MLPATQFDVFVWSLGLTFLFETLTLFMRFGLGLEWAAVSRSTVGVLTFGVRVHHSFVGLILLLGASLMVDRLGMWQGLAFATGWGLLFSDLIHHFLVLWPITGRPQFHLLYRQSVPTTE